MEADRPRRESFQAQEPTFLGEQSGVPEAELQRRVTPLLRAHRAVQRAYLARLSYGPSAAPVVALCIRSSMPDEDLVGRIGAVFASMFGWDQHLDMLFLDEKQERDLAAVCPAFFSSGR